MNKIVIISREFISEIARRTKLAEDYVQQMIESKPAFSFPINIGVTFHPTFHFPDEETDHGSDFTEPIRL